MYKHKPIKHYFFSDQTLNKKSLHPKKIIEGGDLQTFLGKKNEMMIILTRMEVERIGQRKMRTRMA